jgi:tRNA (guanine-N7-)-methyltransferase
MARKKLARFAENKTFPHLIEKSRSEIEQGFEMRGQWAARLFGNDLPIILELGCGKGEYTVGMAEAFPERNFIGIDIKGARLWYGAKEVANKGLTNAAFLRTEIELLDVFFAPGEISEIWITFPDPQIKYKRAKHRLTHPHFLERYQRLLQPSGVVHLKTDSAFLHGYTLGLLQLLNLPVHESFHDIDMQIPNQPEHLLHRIKTHYEQLFRNKGYSITYIRFGFNGPLSLSLPTKK